MTISITVITFIFAIILLTALIICVILYLSAVRRAAQIANAFQTTDADLQRVKRDLMQKANDDKSWQGDINRLEQKKSQTLTEINRIKLVNEGLSDKQGRLRNELSAAQQASGLPSVSDNEYIAWLRKLEKAEEQQAAVKQFMRDREPVWQKTEDLLKELRQVNAAMPFMQNMSAYFPAWVDAAKQKIAADRGAEQNLQSTEKERDNLAETLKLKQDKLAKLTEQAERQRQNWRDRISALFGGRLDSEMAKNIPALQNLADAERQAKQLLAEQRENTDLLAQTLRQLPEEDAESLKPSIITIAIGQAEEERKVNEEAYRQTVQTQTEAQREWDNIGKEDETARLSQQKMTLGLELQDLLQNYAEQRLGLRLAQKALASYRDAHRGGMMLATERAFKELTNGAYPQMQTSLDGDSQVLQAVPSDGGGLKRADAMSKGTRFQLYMALRAAAYEQLLAQGKNLPFFCDDVFETFDDDRTRSACRLMQHIGSQGQAIYFTHHRHVTEIAKEICGNNVQIHEI